MSSNPRTIIATGKTVEDAVKSALSDLSLTIDRVEVKVLDQGSSGGLFGIGSKSAKVEVIEIAPASLEERAEEHLRRIISLMGYECEIESSMQDGTLKMNVSGISNGNIIGMRGETLDALQYMVNLYVNKGREQGDFIRVSLDSENYRDKREKTLVNLAKSIATKVVKFRKDVALEPMTAYERRIIHSTLQNNKYIVTKSVGDEPNRKIVVSYRR